MPRYKLIIQMDAAEGREDEFLDYYASVHVHDVVKVPGVLSGQLLRRVATMSDGGAPLWSYLVEYDVDCADPAALMDEIRGRMARGELRANPNLLGSPRSTVFYEAVSEVMLGTPARSR